jgi:predicted O-linked N-acetylglucosamine transferase (SPINDLY family)
MRKIEPIIFGAWMDILKRVPNAVLWLLPFSSDAARNLHVAAGHHGVRPSRIVFAPFLPKGAHLGRVALADLSLDTLYWGGHTTTSDSLWAGLPVITTPGSTFASRVAGSLLTAIGLPELIAPTLAEYVELAVALAQDRDRLAGLRQRLVDNRLTAPLFDTDRYVRDLERAYLHVWTHHEKGLPPESFTLDPAP